ncbi:MAG: hypothetical protein RLY43_2246 [Bacteroidota bacterium]|jgi:hypothetical protein
MTKSILIKAVIEGSGIVNFDSNDQRYLWVQQKDVEKHGVTKYKNASFGKGRYYKHTETKGEEEKEYLVKVPVISADCIRHAMYEDVMGIMLPNVMHDDSLLLNVIANPCMIERGYLFARDGKTIWKRKSSFMISYAKGTSTSAPLLETYSNTQPKTGENKSEEGSDTSFFKREVRGDTTYEVSGVIDIGELGFISVSEIHDRLSFDSDYSAKYREFLSQRIGSDISEPAFYLKNGDIYNIPEQGIHLTNEQVRYCVEDILKRLARMNITRAVTGFAKTKSISIKFVNDPLEDTMADSNCWIEIFNGKLDLSALDSCVFNSTYTKTDLQEEAKNKIEQYKKKFGYVKKEKG